MSAFFHYLVELFAVLQLQEQHCDNITENVHKCVILRKSPSYFTGYVCKCGRLRAGGRLLSDSYNFHFVNNKTQELRS